jgi:hypothetical protein
MTHKSHPQCVQGILQLFMLTWIGVTPLLAQCDSGPQWDFALDESEGINVLSLLSNVVTPQIVRDTREIRRFIRDPRFAELRTLCGDLRAVDAIYVRALKIAEFNIARALVIAMMGTLEHQRLNVRMPLVGALPLPLTFEEDDLFAARVKNLPSQLYWDTPAGEHGDKDKLQHFFASAYIAYVTDSPEIARAAGNLVEWGEAQFIVGGADDQRDKRANKHGEMFGHDLVYVKTLLPSDYFTLPVDEE